MSELYLEHLEKFLSFLLAAECRTSGNLPRSRIMESASRVPHRRKLVAYVLPMALFLGLLAVGSGLKKIGGPFWLSLAGILDFPAANAALRRASFFFSGTNTISGNCDSRSLFSPLASSSSCSGFRRRRFSVAQRDSSALIRMFSRSQPLFTGPPSFFDSRALLLLFLWSRKSSGAVFFCGIWSTKNSPMFRLENSLLSLSGLSASHSRSAFDARLDCGIHYRHGLQRRCLPNKKSDLMRVRSRDHKPSSWSVDHAYTPMGILVR